MKALVVLLIAGLALSGMAGLTLAQSAKQPVTSTTTSTPLPTAKLHSLAGQVVSVDQAAKSLIVRRAGKNPRELTFAVDEKAASTLADLHPGDRIKVSYTEMGGKLNAAAIVKTPHKGT